MDSMAWAPEPVHIVSYSTYYSIIEVLDGPISYQGTGISVLTDFDWENVSLYLKYYSNIKYNMNKKDYQ